ncbi:MAG TPA: hypothetical protein VFN09_00730 [Rhodanobacteraceae bacterium]|nr:hypothetical protein [Rhodanobacteraceae bacterium]
MKATWQLLSAPARRMPVGTALVGLLYLAGFVLAAWLHIAPPLGITVAACWLWHILAGVTGRSLLRPETLLLPRFRWQLALVGLVDGLLTVVLPLAAFVALIGPAHLLLIFSGLALAAVLGLASGLGLRAVFVFWVVALIAGWMPQFSTALAMAALHSPLTPILLLLAAGLLLNMALRPLLTLRDRAEDESPMQAIADGRKPLAAADGTPQQRGFVGKRLSSLFDSIAQQALARALTRFRRQPSGGARRQLLRTLLLPHDNPSTVVIRLVWVALVAALYFFATHATQRWHAGYVGAWAVVLGITRFSAVGQGMVRMRPNLADLYLTLAPQRKADFQRDMADVLLWLVGVALFNCVAYAALAGVLLHEHDFPRLLLAALIAGIGGAFGALAAHLVGPESTTGRGLVQIFVMAATAGVYALVYWLLGRFGLWIGGAASLALTLPFGIGAWQAARTEYLKRDPRFDVPL